MITIRNNKYTKADFENIYNTLSKGMCGKFKSKECKDCQCLKSCLDISYAIRYCKEQISGE